MQAAQPEALPRLHSYSLPPQPPSPPPSLAPVAEEWRHEPRGMEGQQLVWVDCEELMSYADK